MRRRASEMERRVAAAQATLDRFRDRPFRWGSADCARMVAWHLRKMGYRPALAKAGAYRTALSARAALKRLGHDSLADALDALGLVRIGAASAIVGDVLALPGDDPLGALVVAVGNGRVVGWHEDAAGAAVMQPLIYGAAWRVTPV